VPDKGLDRVFVFRLEATAGKLAATDPAFVATRSGAGPRHVAFHPALPVAYVVNELDSTVATYRFDAATGALTPLQVITTLPTSHVGNSTGAAIAVTPSGRFLFASNRGHDSIAVFAADRSTGLLEHAGWHATQGQVPRFVTLDPTGSVLLAANQSSDTIVSFRIDQEKGGLEPTGQVVQEGSPVSIVFRQD
jgi:6-phosphogluconolactonase (cycloisomerase 2 family)